VTKAVVVSVRKRQIINTPLTLLLEDKDDEDDSKRLTKGCGIFRLKVPGPQLGIEAGRTL
jgi:hypothetical protein